MMVQSWRENYPATTFLWLLCFFVLKKWRWVGTSGGAVFFTVKGFSMYGAFSMSGAEANFFVGCCETSFFLQYITVCVLNSCAALGLFRLSSRLLGKNKHKKKRYWLIATPCSFLPFFSFLVCNIRRSRCIIWTAQKSATLLSVSIWQFLVWV